MDELQLHVDTVNTLKLEGNDLYKKQDFTAASQKYTEAINACKDNKTLAILHSNRAAVSTKLNDYLHAIIDGQTATKADPDYMKGYIRTGTAASAVGMWDVSLRSWRMALGLITDSDPLLKVMCKAHIDAAEAAQTKRQKEISRVTYKPGSRAGQVMPWVRAKRLWEQNRLPLQSSGNVILRATVAFEAALTDLKRLNMKGRMIISAEKKVLEKLTNAVLCDQRVFHVEDGSNFFRNMQQQIIAEMTGFNGWPDSTPVELMKQIPKRLRASDWDTVRPAVAITIRAWIWRAYMEANMGGAGTADQFYKWVIDMLEWGLRTYANVPTEDRGAIFATTFLRAVRNLRLDNLIGLYGDKGAKCSYTLDDIVELARDLKSETEASEGEMPSEGKGFFDAFWTYPLASAISVIGWYHMERGHEHVSRAERAKNQDTGLAIFEDAVTEYTQSAQWYIQAAETYPPDDEYHPYLLAVALEAYWRGHAPLRITIPLARRVQEATPKAMEIWEATMNSEKSRSQLEQVDQFLKRCDAEIAKGKWTLDDSFGGGYELRPKTWKMRQKE